MTEKAIKLEGIHEVKEFNAAATAFPVGVDLKSGKYYVNAKSILGIFSLDLDKPLVMVVDSDDEQTINECFGQFICE